MSKVVEEYLFKAIVRCMSKDYKEFREWTSLAAREQEKERIENMLHAKVYEILESKGVSIC